MIVFAILIYSTVGTRQYRYSPIEESKDGLNLYELFNHGTVAE